jgi:hypothetical protein
MSCPPSSALIASGSWRQLYFFPGGELTFRTHRTMSRPLVEPAATAER